MQARSQTRDMFIGSVFRMKNFLGGSTPHPPPHTTPSHFSPLPSAALEKMKMPLSLSFLCIPVLPAHFLFFHLFHLPDFLSRLQKALCGRLSAHLRPNEISLVLIKDRVCGSSARTRGDGDGCRASEAPARAAARLCLSSTVLMFLRRPGQTVSPVAFRTTRFLFRFEQFCS